jgi:hypothetical protein
MMLDHWDFLSTCRQIINEIHNHLRQCECGKWIHEDDPCPHCGAWPPAWEQQP